MRTSRLLLVATAATLAAPLALAQWQWIDKDGRKVFSDRPPPPDVPQQNVLRQPHQRAPTAAAAPAASAASALPKPSGKDKELEEKKRQADEAEAAKKKAEEERIARARAENCERARQAKATVDSGIRIAQLNAQGERIILDDQARGAEARRAQEVIASDCGKAPAALQ
ncbi:DUF4124 domain-containing protein [Xylophilus sp.]|uniref:DUF4124 domain-containing protein n=1 Tax=Xylophilus sp. TaxID=2653893 RepID=UPI0013B915AA|nr:DUF4124 domain-containing protein [Xylophilus sp.]KAF1042612.1 MAG: hypothetical protein GAK38_04261 [Xylophilus sp.]